MFRNMISGLQRAANTLIMAPTLPAFSSILKNQSSLGTLSKLLSPFSLAGTPRARPMATLEYMHRQGPHIKKRPPRQPLDGAPLKKGVILKTLIKKPKKPNSANRKCVLVRLNTGKEMVAYVPKEGHNLQEHNIVLVRVGRVQDLPGVKLKCVRGVYDLGHVVKKK